MDMRIAWFFVLLSLLVNSAYALPPDVLDRSWSASVELTGAGDPDAAIHQMRELAELNQVVYSNLRYHQQTRSFVDAMWANLESFNLTDFFLMLPEENGEWRQLRVYGARTGSHYNIGPEPAAVGIQAGAEPERLGDMVMLMQARKVPGDFGQHYLMRGSMSMGVGRISWPSVQLAASETLSVLVDGVPALEQVAKDADIATLRAKIKTMNPALGDEDVDVITPLWLSFPAMWELLSRLGRVDDLVLADSGLPYRKLKVSFTIDPVRMAQFYPKLAEHLLQMNHLFKGDFRLVGDHGELFSAELDSRELAGSFQAYIADGRIIPSRDGRVNWVEQPVADSQNLHYILHMNSTMSILGVKTHVDDAQAHIKITQGRESALLQGQMNKVPGVRVEGRALGFLPTAMIDVMLPKNLNQIVTEFMRVVCEGNDGRGIEISAEFDGGRNTESSHITLETIFESLDNMFVRIGMGVVNDRFVPDAEASSELDTFVFDVQQAFASDLDAFETIIRSRNIASANLK